MQYGPILLDRAKALLSALSVVPHPCFVCLFIDWLGREHTGGTAAPDVVGVHRQTGGVYLRKEHLQSLDKVAENINNFPVI